MYDYDGCYICGEQMEEKRVKQDFWIKGKLIVIEDVPAGVCPRCGEKLVKADVGRGIAALIQDSKKLKRAKVMNVPIIKFEREVA